MAYVVATLPTRIDWLIVPTDRPKESFAVPVLTTIKEKRLTEGSLVATLDELDSSYYLDNIRQKHTISLLTI